MSGSFTRIASISGLRGIVGAGIDPVVAAEFAAAYASECEAGADRFGSRRTRIGPDVRSRG